MIKFSQCFASFLVASFLSKTLAWHNCSGDGICPNGNKCCPSDVPGQSYCLSGEDDNAGSCCTEVGSGCSDGYVCLTNRTSEYCWKIDPPGFGLPAETPRYRLCSLPDKTLKEYYGLPVIEDSEGFSVPQLAYLSTMGPIDDESTESRALQDGVKTVVIMIHGSLRTAEDYLCSTNAALPNAQQNPLNSTMLVIAPWFLAPQDAPIEFANRNSSVQPLRWLDHETVYLHSWRYGADAAGANISSFAVLDRMVENLVERLPSLERIVLAGHSAGGQYVQRWALLSNSPVLANKTHTPTVKTRIVAGNPKSYSYLDERRLQDGKLQPLDQETIAGCPNFNAWTWGFGISADLPCPYKDNAIEEAGGIGPVIDRYPMRDVVYLSGELDQEKNGHCEAQLQGKNRLQRSEYYFAALKQIYGRTVHNRIVVRGVHHDHCLMFQSDEGREAMFGSFLKQKNKTIG